MPPVQPVDPTPEAAESYLVALERWAPVAPFTTADKVELLTEAQYTFGALLPCGARAA